MFGEQYFLLAAILVTGLAAWFDWRTGEIPNWLTLGPLAIAPLAHAGFSLKAGWGEAGQGFAFSILGIITCGLIPIFLYRAGAIGGGDVKLLGAVGALLRPMTGIETEMYSFIVAALYAPVRLAYEGKLLRTLGNSLLLVRNVFVPKDKRKELTTEMMSELRFGPSIFVATLIALLLHWRG
ncbi:MAG: A24 family peptidase [Polyangiaceae bacterium]